MPAALRTSTYVPHERGEPSSRTVNEDEIVTAKNVANVPAIFPREASATSVGEAKKNGATLPSPSAMANRSPVTVLAEWNGSVDHVGPFYFSASLNGLSGEGVEGQYEDAEIPLSDVAESDFELLVPGSFFRLTVCMEVRADGQPRRYTQVVFRRLPAYRAHDLDIADQRALERHRGLRVE